MYDVDFFNNQVNIGDQVVFEAPGYRSFVIGKVITKAEKSCQIKYINNWNFTRGRELIVRQGYNQIIKCIPKIHGQWLGEADGYADGYPVYDVWYCSECNYCIDDGTDDPECLPNYCPNCGAKMDGEKETNKDGYA